VKVLLVDDSEATLTSLLMLLQDHGYSDVVCARSGDEAMERLARSDPPDGAMPAEVILLDVDLPGIDGIETCRRIKAAQRYHDIPVLIITGDTQVQTLEAAFAAGACDYINKPIEPVELLARMRSAMNLKRELDNCKTREKELVEVTGRLQKLNEELQRLAILDELTGIANRRFFNVLLQQEWGRAAREVVPLSLLIIDIDFFKNYNDHFGYPPRQPVRRSGRALSREIRPRAGRRAAARGSRQKGVSCRRRHTQPPLPIRCEGETGADVLRGQIRKVGKDLLGRHPRSQVFQDVLHGQAQSPDARLAAAFVRFNRNQLRVVHDVTLQCRPAPVNEPRAAGRHAQ